MNLLRTLKSVAKHVVPAGARGWLRTERVRLCEDPPFGEVNWGDLRRVTPIHTGFDRGRGLYVDRYYIEQFLAAHAANIRGRVLELADNEYTMKFGGARVVQSDVLDVRADYAAATIVGDLTTGENIPSEAFDCVILTQALHVIYDVRAALGTVHRILKPGGCVLVTAPGITPIAPNEWEYCGDYWRFTRLSMRKLFEEFFPAGCVEVESRGNVLAATAFLQGIAAEELTPQELDATDPYYEVSVLCRAVKPAAAKE